MTMVIIMVRIMLIRMIMPIALTATIRVITLITLIGALLCNIQDKVKIPLYILLIPTDWPMKYLILNETSQSKI